MKRLTVRNGNMVKLKLYSKSIAARDQELTKNFNLALKKLADYEDKAENGTLVELPSKAGDTIWFIWLNTLAIQEAKVSQILIDESSKSIKVNYNYAWTLFDFEYLGRWWFLTKEEAEAKLKELKENE